MLTFEVSSADEVDQPRQAPRPHGVGGEPEVAAAQPVLGGAIAGICRLTWWVTRKAGRSGQSRAKSRVWRISSVMLASVARELLRLGQHVVPAADHRDVSRPRRRDRRGVERLQRARSTGSPRCRASPARSLVELTSKRSPSCSATSSLELARCAAPSRPRRRRPRHRRRRPGACRAAAPPARRRARRPCRRCRGPGGEDIVVGGAEPRGQDRRLRSRRCAGLPPGGGECARRKPRRVAPGLGPPGLHQRLHLGIGVAAPDQPGVRRAGVARDAARRAVLRLGDHRRRIGGAGQQRGLGEVLPVAAVAVAPDDQRRAAGTSGR